MQNLYSILKQLKDIGCSGVKISFEDEGALYNEIITMRNLTTSVGLELSVKIGGCEAKRDIVDCIDLHCDSIVAPMVESKFALHKYLKSLDLYNYNKKKGFNLETIQAYNNLEELSMLFNNIDFVTFGRVDYVGSMNKDREYVDSNEVFEMVKKVFQKARENGTQCYLGGAISSKSANFIKKLADDKLIDKFETRYIIYDIHKSNMNDFNILIYLANVFELEWMKYIRQRYSMHANKDIKRITMIEDRISKNSRL
jgi:4-hydroxy-2-oxoheptanedioate aldolase